MSKGKLFIISGPSGVGKGAVVKLLLERMPELVFSVSATTRAPRHGEQEGVNYYYVSTQCFEQMIRNGELLEYNRHFDNYYGTPKKYVEEALEKGKSVILEIEVMGALHVKQAMPDSKLIFIEPPSLDELKRRLEMRHTETNEQILTRLKRVDDEMSGKHRYDYVVTNDILEKTVDIIENIIKENVYDNKTSN